MEMRLYDWQVGYIAAMIDGEGTISLYSDSNEKRYHKQANIVEITSTDRVLPETLVNITNLGMFYEKGKRKNLTHKNAYAWRVQPRVEILMLLNKVRPYLMLKRRQAELMREFCEGKIADSITEKRATEIEKEMRELNRRGR